MQLVRKVSIESKVPYIEIVGAARKESVVYDKPAADTAIVLYMRHHGETIDFYITCYLGIYRAQIGFAAREVEVDKHKRTSKPVGFEHFERCRYVVCFRQAAAIERITKIVM